ncbi:MAG: N-carbamoyl-L-amino-acid hydrolase [Gammaproteobacteria bacterium]|jgi:N-carbamoyl-L-amino-acid hydrolase
MTELKDLRVDGNRLWQSIMAMAEIGPGQHGGSCRLALTDADRDGRELFLGWCREIGCSLKVDDMGNLFVRRDGGNPNRDPIASGSHLDTQPHGGKFDGIYGVLATLEVFRALHDADVVTDAPLEIIVWTNEEGSRFAPAMIASGVYAGLFEKEFAWSQTDTDGITLKSELERTGYMGDEICGDHKIAALLEAHIEQGPILERFSDQIGVVQGAQGQRWFDVVIRGQDSHAGSTPMEGRKDALVASSEIIGKLQTLALDNAPDAVATVGQLIVSPNSRNTIPGEVSFSVDMRNPDDQVLSSMNEAFRSFANEAAAKQSVEIDIQQIWHIPPILFDEACVAAVESSAVELGYAHRSIVSGAGHDACQVCQKIPTAMIFVPCAGGLSHNEAESATLEDLEAGCNVLLQSILKLAS